MKDPLLVALPFVALIAATSFVSSCGSVRPITANSVIDGHPATAVTVVLAAPFSFKHLLSTVILPAGRYEPAFEDDAGAYFLAPTKIVESDPLAASAFFDGGLYFRTDGSRRTDAYVIVRNQPLFIALPEDFHYALAARADAR